MPVSEILAPVLAMIVRRLRFIIASIVLLGALSAFLILGLPPRYVSQATMIVKYGREHTLQSLETGEPLVVGAYAQDDILNSAIEILQSSSLMQGVVRTIGVAELYPEMAQVPSVGGVKHWFSGSGPELPEDALARATEKLRKSLRVTRSGRSNLLVVRLIHQDPRMAAMALDRVIDAFVQKYTALYTENLVSVLTEEVATTQSQLVEAEARMVAFERSTLTIDPDAGADRLIGEQQRLAQQAEMLRACCAETGAARDLQQRLDNMGRRIADLSTLRAEQRGYVRAIEAAQAALDNAELRLRRAVNMQDIKAHGLNSVEVVDPAQVPLTSAPPSKSVLLALALMLITAGSTAVAILIELLAPRFSSGRDLARRFDAPVLAEVPFVGKG